MSEARNFISLRPINPAPLVARLTPELWQASPRETYPGSAHSQARSIFVRWVKPPTSNDLLASWFTSLLGKPLMLQELLASTDSADYPAAKTLMPEIGEAVMSVLEQLGAIGEIGHVMLTNLPPGAAIASHMDEGVYADLYDRFHVCLQGDAGNAFECGGEAFFPKPGDAFWFNHKRPHLVRNTGALARIHLIVDVMAPAFTAYRGLYYQAEQVTDLWEEAGPLLQAHWREIAHYQDIALDPAKDTYAVMQARGELACFTARDCGRLVGYAVFFVRQNHHYRGSLQAWQDVLFILPEYRRGLTGVRLLKLAEARLQAQGVQVVYHHAKRTNKVGQLLERLGYELVDEIYAKRLDRR